jgi:hypothetical protein
MTISNCTAQLATPANSKVDVHVRFANDVERLGYDVRVGNSSIKVMCDKSIGLDGLSVRPG